jgi:predicted dehydrogenase
MAYSHAAGYRLCPDVELSACADIVKENGEAFAQETGTKTVYTDYLEMLKFEKLDIVSICTWPKFHAPMVLDALKAGVKLVHCEKPMADSWGAARDMARAAREAGARLSFGHQRRFGEKFRKLLEIRDSGMIGEIRRMECYPANFFDWGTHWLDLFQMVNRETPAEWVLAALHFGKGRRVFEVPHEEQGIMQIKYKNGVEGFLVTSPSYGGAALRFTGDKGVAEIHWPEPPVRIWRKGPGDYEALPVKDPQDGNVAASIVHVVESFRAGRDSELCAENALRGTEIIFAAYESVRRRGRVDLPLDIHDHPLVDMISTGIYKEVPKP